MLCLQRNYIWSAIALSTMVCAACSSSADEPASTTSADLVATQSNAQSTRFHAHLSGTFEVPPVDTTATGQISLDASMEDEISYRLIVANISDVVAAHIHCAPAGENGPIGVTLFMGAPISPNGVLAQGTITAPDADNGCGWADIAAVVEAMTSGNAYVNVHTQAHLSGEMRGQVR
jgi:hypothetical protein